MSLVRRLILLMAASSLLVAPTAAPAHAEPSPAPPEPPARILLYGDSLTQSFSGDWTWRYRLWQSLKASGQDFDFVGPRNDVVEYTTRKPGSQGYRNPHFDRDHASLAGMSFLDGDEQPAQLAATHRPQVIVALVGTDDLLETKDVAALIGELRAHWRQQIIEARASDHGVDLLLVPIPQNWIAGAGDYNAMLNELAAELNTKDERVVVAPQASFDRWTDTFDQVHPSTSGEIKVATAVSEALAGLGIGQGAAATASADPPDDHTWAPQPTASVTGTTATITWPSVTYASSENVWVRDRTTGVTAPRLFITGTSTTLSGAAGHSYDVWLEPVQGNLPIGTTSDTIQVDIPAG